MVKCGHVTEWPPTAQESYIEHLCLRTGRVGPREPQLECSCSQCTAWTSPCISTGAAFEEGDLSLGWLLSSHKHVCCLKRKSNRVWTVKEMLYWRSHEMNEVLVDSWFRFQCKHLPMSHDIIRCTHPWVGLTLDKTLTVIRLNHPRTFPSQSHV